MGTESYRALITSHGRPGASGGGKRDNKPCRDDGENSRTALRGASQQAVEMARSLLVCLGPFIFSYVLSTPAASHQFRSLAACFWVAL